MSNAADEPTHFAWDAISSDPANQRPVRDR